MTKEDTISMYLGLAVVMVFGLLLVMYLNKHKGSVSVPGISTSTEKQTENKTGVAENDQTFYVVKKNDSLWKIAVSRYGDGNKWEEIAKANKIQQPGLIFQGDKLAMPVIEKQTENGHQPKMASYVVVKGDNLWRISVNNYGDGFAWTKVWMANKTLITNPDKLEVGMKLTLPEW